MFPPPKVSNEVITKDHRNLVCFLCSRFSWWDSACFILSTSDLRPSPVKTKLRYHSTKLQLCVPAMVSLLNTWTSFPGAIIGGDNRTSLSDVFRKTQASSKPDWRSAGLCRMGVFSTPFTFGSQYGACRTREPEAVAFSSRAFPCDADYEEY